MHPCLFSILKRSGKKPEESPIVCHSLSWIKTIQKKHVLSILNKYFISQVKYIDPNFPFDNLWEYKLAKNIGELFSSRSTRTQSSYRFLKDIDYR